MTTHQKFKQLLPGLAIFVVAFVLFGCATEPKRSESNTYTPPNDLREELRNEVSLEADRSELAEIRKDVPELVRKENDELAFYLKMMETETKSPTRIRSRFNTLYNRKRNRFRKIQQRERTRFRKEEDRLKKEALGDLKKERKAFYAKKPSREAMKEFSRDQDEVRKRFFANQRERKKDFSDQMREMRREFDQNMRDLRTDFNRAFREYKKAYSDRKKREKLNKISPPTENVNPSQPKNTFQKEFDAMDSKPRQMLKPSEDGK